MENEVWENLKEVLDGKQFKTLEVTNPAKLTRYHSRVAISIQEDKLERFRKIILTTEAGAYMMYKEALGSLEVNSKEVKVIATSGAKFIFVLN